MLGQLQDWAWRSAFHSTKAKAARAVGSFLTSQSFTLGLDVLVPDLAGWRRERMPELPETAAFTLAPDWICEVLSPSTAQNDRVAKMHIYGREAVDYGWLIDPLTQVLEVFKRQGEFWTRRLSACANEVVRAAPFDAIELELSSLWER